MTKINRICLLFKLSLPEPLGFENKEKRFTKRVFQSFNFVRLL